MVYFLKLAVLGLATVPATLATILVGLFDPYGKHVYWIFRLWAWIILVLGGISVRVDGIDRLKPHERYLFMVNHQSNVDIPVLVRSISGFQLRWIAKKELFRIPLFGWAMRAAKHIAVDRADSAGARAVLKKAALGMANGISLVVFPEGTRSPDARLLPFKRGGFWLAAKNNVPIVPVTITGSHKLLPKGEWRLRPGTVEVHVGAPIATTGRRVGELSSLVAEVRGVIEANLSRNGAAMEAAHGDSPHSQSKDQGFTFKSSPL
jgi:1-acyl-sn-glycerol-3-phosphate acyltransferase